MRTQGEGGHLQARKRNILETKLALRLPNLQNSEKINGYSLSHPVWGIWLWQPKLRYSGYSLTVVTQAACRRTAGMTMPSQLCTLMCLISVWCSPHPHEPALWKESESEVAQSCPTLCNPMNCLPGSSIHGIFQARILEWVAISFSRRSSWPRDWAQVSRIVGTHFIIWATRQVQQCDWYQWKESDKATFESWATTSWAKL